MHRPNRKKLTESGEFEAVMATIFLILLIVGTAGYVFTLLKICF